MASRTAATVTKHPRRYCGWREAPKQWTRGICSERL